MPDQTDASEVSTTVIDGLASQPAGIGPASNDTSTLAGVHVRIPTGSTEVLIALTMLLVLILRPDGLTGGKEFRLPRRLLERGGSSNLDEQV